MKSCLRTIVGPNSSDFSLVIHIFLKLSSDVRFDPPIKYRVLSLLLCDDLHIDIWQN